MNKNIKYSQNFLTSEKVLNQIIKQYNSTKEFLKERTSDLQAFKSLFKDLVDTISNKIGRKDLENNFKTEYDKENRRITRDRGMSR